MSRMFKKIFFLSVASGLLLASCSNNPSKTDGGNASIDTSKTAAELKLDNQGKQLMYAMPSPVEAAALLKSSGAKFDIANLNATKNVSHYTTGSSRALNLGVYATDLVYANIFGQTQESAEYFRCANTLGTALGIKDAFGEAVYKRMKSNMDNKDSLMAIIAEASMDADSYFKENERAEGSALVATGGWLEGLFISCRIAEKSKDPILMNRMAEQKHSLGTLIALLSGITLDKESLPVLEGLKALKVEFDGLELKSDESKPAKAEGTNTIGPKKHLVMTPDKFKTISEKAYELRNSIIK